LLLLAAALGILGAFARAGAVAAVNAVLAHGPNAALAATFAALCVLQLALGAGGHFALHVLGQNTMTALRGQLSEAIVALPQRKLEELGSGKLLAALTDDVMVLTRAGHMLAGVINQAAFIVASMIYLAWLSPKAFVLVALIIALSVVIGRVLSKRSLAVLTTARDVKDTMHKGFHGITSGTKELKLHARRLNDFVAQMVEAPGLSYLGSERMSAGLGFVGGQATSFLFLLLVGVLLFEAPRVQLVDPTVLTSYVLAILAVQATVEVFIRSYPLMQTSDVALGKLEELGLAIKEAAEPTAVVPLEGCKEIELRGVVHEYRREQEDGVFQLGPIDLVLRPGEIVFIVGGNGSGKSSLVKVLTGLYPPLKGEIRVDGRSVDDVLRPAYRQLFSAVFSDCYLFDKLHGIDAAKVAAEATAYLEQLRLDKKVTIKDGGFSTSKLSQGQRKRLMLLIAYLEDRPIYVFDEWASDQDPLFKDVFYRSILPGLRAKGKMVVVVSHDDRYFELADRVIALESGHLTPRALVSSPVEAAASASAAASR